MSTEESKKPATRASTAKRIQPVQVGMDTYASWLDDMMYAAKRKGTEEEDDSEGIDFDDEDSMDVDEMNQKTLVFVICYMAVKKQNVSRAVTLHEDECVKQALYQLRLKAPKGLELEVFSGNAFLADYVVDSEYFENATAEEIWALGSKICIWADGYTFTKDNGFDRVEDVHFVHYTEKKKPGK